MRRSSDLLGALQTLPHKVAEVSEQVEQHPPARTRRSAFPEMPYSASMHLKCGLARARGRGGARQRVREAHDPSVVIATKYFGSTFDGCDFDIAAPGARRQDD